MQMENIAFSISSYTWSLNFYTVLSGFFGTHFVLEIEFSTLIATYCMLGLGDLA